MNTISTFERAYIGIYFYFFFLSGILVGAGGDKSEPRQLLNKLSTLAEHVSNSGY